MTFQRRFAVTYTERGSKGPLVYVCYAPDAGEAGYKFESDNPQFDTILLVESAREFSTRTGIDLPR